MAYCTKCGKSNPDTAKFCTACGAALTVSAPLQQQTSVATAQTATSKKNTWIILLIVGVLGLGAGAYFLFFNKNKKHNPQGIVKSDTTEAPSLTNNTPQNSNPAQEQTNSSSSTKFSYIDEYGKLVYRSDCYIIVTGSFVDENFARDYVNTMKNEGHPNSGYLWIPDYPSLSGKQFYATFIGPYQSYEECENNLRTLKVNSRFWYGKKVSYSSEQIEIRIK